MNKQKFEEKILKCSHQNKFQDEWYIVFSENTKTNHSCICGHHVKRITYIYNKFTKYVMLVGSTCAKKFGIKHHLQNSILLLTIKNIICQNQTYTEDSGIVSISNLANILKEYIQSKYLDFQEKIKVCIMNDVDIDYYDIVLPFRRLLNDVCYLVTEYDYDFMVLLKEIESNVNAMNNTVKHMIIDETVEGEGDKPFRIIEIVQEEDDEEYSNDSKISIIDEAITIQADNIYILPCEYDTQNIELCKLEDSFLVPTIQYEIPDLFICEFCDEDFANSNERNIHERICVDNHECVFDDDCINEYQVEVGEAEECIEYEEAEVEADECIEYEEAEKEEVKAEKEDEEDESKKRTIAIESYIAETKCIACIRKSNKEESNIESNKEELTKIKNHYCFCSNRYRLRRLAMDIMDLKKDMTEFSLKSAELMKNACEFREKIDANITKYGVPFQKYEYITV